MEDWSSVKQNGAALGQETLFTTVKDERVPLSEGYIPLLVNLTVEDKAAKGLRKHKGGNEREKPVYVSALEAVQDNRFLLLTGESGSGKTTFARYLLYCHAVNLFNSERKEIVRNEDGQRRDENVNGIRIVPLLVTITNMQDLMAFDGRLLATLKSWESRENRLADYELLVILDGIENAGNQAMEYLVSIATAISRNSHVRLLVLNTDGISQDWILPTGFSKLQILPLLVVQRQELTRKLDLDTDFGSGIAASRPAIFALSLAAGHVGDSGESALDTWLRIRFPSPEIRQAILRAAHDDWSGDRKSQVHPLASAATRWPFAWCTAVQELLVAAQLETSSFQKILEVFDKDENAATPVIRSLLHRFGKGEKQQKLISELLNLQDNGATGDKGYYAALVACEFIDPNDKPLVTHISNILSNMLNLGALPISRRILAGRYLSLFGDPRDLTDLVDIPGGASIFGSTNHPNSNPVHELYLESFKIGVFPVVNRDYAEFVKQTSRAWPSQDAHDPYSQNKPATDLTWHDARAYCQWLTQNWRKTGKIKSNETVQLPSEPQWERAARGNQQESQADQNIYPWGTNFTPSLSNCDELALNDKCAVGLFPHSGSPFGCYDMTGQIVSTMPIINDVQLSSPRDLIPLVKGGEPIYVILTSSNDEETGAPWCSDVRAALPFLKGIFHNQEGPKAIYESVGPRPGWKRPDNAHKAIVGVIAAVPGLIEIIKAVSTAVRGLTKGKVAVKTTQELLTQLQDLESILQDIKNRWKPGGSDQLRLERLVPSLKQLKTELISLRLVLQNSSITKEPSRYLKKALFLSTGLEKSLSESFIKLSQLKTSLTLLIAHRQDAITQDLVIKSYATRRLELKGLLQPSSTNFIPNKTAGTCDWIWSHSTFCNWLQASSGSYFDRVLCVFGTKGCGKSVLVKATSEAFKTKNKIALHFSFWSGSEAQQKLLNLLRTLVWQISGHIKDENLEQISQPCIKSPVLDAHVLVNVLRISLSLIKEKVYFIIDGIDESSDDWNDRIGGSLSTVLDLAKDHNNLHVLLSGRASSMRTVLKKSCPKLEITASLIRDDLQKVITAELDTSLAMHSQVIRDMIQESLKARSHIMFLWVTLVLKELGRCFSVEEVRQTLTHVPHDLDREYHRLFAQHMAHTRGTNSKPSTSMKRARYLLYALLACPEPMTDQDLCYAYASQCNSSGTIDDDLITVDGIMDACGDFLAVTEDRYHLIHASVSEFLLRSEDKWNLEDSEISYFRVDLTEAHESMRSACFKYIESIDLGYPLTDDGVSVLQSRFPFLPYVAKFLPFYLTQVQDRKRQSRKEAFEPFGTHHFSVFAEYLMVTVHNTIHNQQADFADHWIELVMSGAVFKDVAVHFNSELRRRLQLFGVQHERYQSWLHLAVFFQPDTENTASVFSRPVTIVSRKSRTSKAVDSAILSSIPEHVGQSQGLAVQRLSQSLGAVSGLFTVLKNSTGNLIASTTEPLSIPMILLATTVARQQKKWPLAERLAVTLVRKTSGHRNFYELCGLLSLASIKIHINEDYSKDVENMVQNATEIANRLPDRPHIEILKVEAYTLLIKVLACTDRPEQAIECAQLLERAIGKNREKCRSLVWDYSLGHTKRGFAWRVDMLHTAASWLQSAGAYAAAADFTSQAIDIFNMSGAEPNSELLNLYNTQMMALYDSRNFTKLLSTGDKHLEVFQKCGPKASNIHTRWTLRSVQSDAFAAMGDEGEATRCCCEAADEVHRLGVNLVQQGYEPWLVDLAKDLAHFGQYDKSVSLCHELLKAKQLSSRRGAKLDRDTMLDKLQPLVSKLTALSLVGPDYTRFLRCYSLLYLIHDLDDDEDESDWLYSEALKPNENVPRYKDNSPLLLLLYIETCLHDDIDSLRASLGYEALAQFYFDQECLEAASIVAHDAASRLLSNFSLDDITTYREISTIFLISGDVFKSKAWLALSYEKQRDSASTITEIFKIELDYASRNFFMTTAWGKQIEYGNVRDSFIERAWDHLMRAIEVEKLYIYLQPVEVNGWSAYQDFDHGKIDPNENDATVADDGAEIEYRDNDDGEAGDMYDSKELRDETIYYLRTQMEELGNSDIMTKVKTEFESEMTELRELKRSNSQVLLRKPEEPRRRETISYIRRDADFTV
ncbi:serine threonine- kinase pkn1 [Fusarium longipes]|uniref:Serine threonine-kinase pkn1 n=1 Tax=Fusarium longipes TaxID=694270 RepID=A0A395T684_9HYPO|nr:serine threonine- kinase pkn1 [Fusarium longipes]